MPFSLESKPYGTARNPSGIYVAETVKPLGVKSALALPAAHWETVPHGENKFYELLQNWLLPVMHDFGYTVSTIYGAPEDLPSIIRNQPLDAKTALTVTTFPTAGDRYMYTVQGLYLRGDVIAYAQDQISDPANHFVCVPTALRRLGILSDVYFRAWKNTIRTSDLTVPARQDWTGHMMAIAPRSDGLFTIGDQYGVGLVGENIVAEMAALRVHEHVTSPKMHLGQIFMKKVG